MKAASPPRRADDRARRFHPDDTDAAVPRVCVVVLNYNGAGHVEPCLASLLATEYPALEVVVVDNASRDGSPATIQRQFPDVAFVAAGANLGFARGNNLALQRASAPLLAVLNPDTTVEPGWLWPLVERLAADPLAGGVGPRILYRHDRVALTLTAPAFRPGGADGRLLGVRLYAASSHAGAASLPVYFNRGVFGREPDHAGRPFCWTGPVAELAAPHPGGALEVRLQLSAGDGRANVPVHVTVDGGAPGEVRVGPVCQTLALTLAPTGVAARPVIENAGIRPLTDGSMRDRGTRLSHGHVWHAWDGPDYAEPREVFAVKGGAALYRRELLASIAYFDPGIFMYYEDADLCWRARRRGWRFWYEPASVVRHAHAALSREWSPGFIRNVEFGKLRMLGKNAPWPWVRRALAANLKFGGAAGLGASRSAVRGRPDAAASGEVRARAQALLQTLLAMPTTMRLRRLERQLAPLDGRELLPFFEAE
ncbi:MAG: glycosyltransferase family 2 protein [Actinobacteria bacterium]|nr:glycosyltransferase family 2 protein [Actinomycetota bacterium]